MINLSMKKKTLNAFLIIVFIIRDRYKKNYTKRQRRNPALKKVKVLYKI